MVRGEGYRLGGGGEGGVGVCFRGEGFGVLGLRFWFGGMGLK
jgi:hypothetical protein